MKDLGKGKSTQKMCLSALDRTGYIQISFVNRFVFLATNPHDRNQNNFSGLVIIKGGEKGKIFFMMTVQQGRVQ